uniref:Uncharacterized protein n=1 Tax=Arthrobacter sp. J3.40 TaxID=347209 RepID=I3W172_9MICC|nr:hypothetical protein [Arthrobacter sp. J3.40]
MVLLLFCRKVGGWGGLVSGQRPLSPVVFGCWRSLRSCGRRRPVYPQGKEREIPGGNQRRRSAAGTFPEPQAPTKEGLDRPERTRTIRQDSSQKASQTTQGQEVRSSATAPPGPNSRPRQRTPFNWLQRSGNQGEPREPALPPRATDNPTAPAAQACRLRPPPRHLLRAKWRSAAANHQHKPATTADRPR